MSLDVRQLLESVIRPTLAGLPPGCAGEAAEHLLLGTAALESEFRALKQYRGGPALGLWQCEPKTHEDIWRNFLAFRPELAQRVRALLSAWNLGDIPDPRDLVGNLNYACAIVRVHYLRAPEPLPRARDVAAMAVYHKRFYNSRLGKTAPGDFERAWARFVSPIL